MLTANIVWDIHMHFIVLVALSIVLFPAAGSAQSVRLSGGGVAVAVPDMSPGATEECPVGSQAVVLTLRVPERGIRARPAQLFGDKEKGLVRERKGTEVREVKVGREEDIGLPADEILKGSMIEGCAFAGGLTYRSARMVMNGKSKDYKIELDHTFDAFAETLDASLIMSYTTELFVGGPRLRSLQTWAGYHNGWGSHVRQMPVLGSLHLRSSAFQWQFEPTRRTAAPIKATLRLDFRFLVLDGGLSAS